MLRHAFGSLEGAFEIAQIYSTPIFFPPLFSPDLAKSTTISVVELQGVSQGNSGSERLRLSTASLTIIFNLGGCVLLFGPVINLSYSWELGYQKL